MVGIASRNNALVVFVFTILSPLLGCGTVDNSLQQRFFPGSYIGCEPVRQTVANVYNALVFAHSRALIVDGNNRIVRVSLHASISMRTRNANDSADIVLNPGGYVFEIVYPPTGAPTASYASINATSNKIPIWLGVSNEDSNVTTGDVDIQEWPVLTGQDVEFEGIRVHRRNNKIVWIKVLRVSP